ncbi:hypothetical protein DERF_012022, partial [Dermatophagoides farinae]
MKQLLFRIIIFYFLSIESTMILVECRRIRLGRMRPGLISMNGQISSTIFTNNHQEPTVKSNDNSTLIIINNGNENNQSTSIYSEWSSWSRCRKRCKQVRTRICIRPSDCQSNIQKEERGCTGDRCRPNYHHHHHHHNNNNHHHHHYQQLIEQRPSGSSNGRGRGGTEFKVLYHLQSYVYSQWSKWSPCTEHCQTRRYRTCEMKEICGNSTIHEDAICAKKGSNCEKYFKSKEDEHQQFDLEGSSTTTNTNSYRQSINASRMINDETCGHSFIRNDMASMLRIIGGREANKGRWPWVVAILNRNHEAFCGGTLITSQFVITAAHCVRRRLYIRAGEHDLMIPEGSEQQEPVSSLFVHPEYDPDTVDNDIALLKLRRPLQMNRFVSPICLPSDQDILPTNSLGTILGWGKRKNSAMFGSDVLHQAQVPIADNDDCRNVYKDKYMISNNMVCAGYKKGKIDSCAGDSGGPLLFSKKSTSSSSTTSTTITDTKWFLYGITSFGEGCGKKNKYGIYAKVPNVVQWIRKTIMENLD